MAVQPGDGLLSPAWVSASARAPAAAASAAHTLGAPPVGEARVDTASAGVIGHNLISGASGQHNPGSQGPGVEASQAPRPVAWYNRPLEEPQRAGGAEAGAGLTPEAAARAALMSLHSAALPSRSRGAGAAAESDEEEEEEGEEEEGEGGPAPPARAKSGKSRRGSRQVYTRNNHTGFFGVHQQGRVFTGAFTIRGKRYLSMGHETAELAARAYDALARQVGLPRERMNFPGPADGRGDAGGEAVVESEGKGTLFSCCCYKSGCPQSSGARSTPGFQAFHWKRKKCPSCNAAKPGGGWPRAQAKAGKRARFTEMAPPSEASKERAALPRGGAAGGGAAAGSGAGAGVGRKSIAQTDPRCCFRAGCVYSLQNVAGKKSFKGWGRSKGTCDGCQATRPKEGWALLYPDQPPTNSLPPAANKKRRIEADAGGAAAAPGSEDGGGRATTPMPHVAIIAPAPRLSLPAPPRAPALASAPVTTPAPPTRGPPPAGVEAFIRSISLSNVESAVAAAMRKRLSLTDFQEARAALASPDSAQARNEDLCFLAGLLDVTEEADIYRLRMAIRKLPSSN